ncbi:MAG TPA: twin-arginine translocase TatA/TatE family subunit [Terracidiphilus sp.]|nr:twin-arginine translocase TatA/TatE family subunit [Terracidiphilus sp.]
MGSPPPIQLATLSMWDTLLLMALALVVFGPRRLPKIGRQLGKLMYEFRKASNDFKFQMEEEFRLSEEADRRKKAEEERQRALAANPAPAQLEAAASNAPQIPAVSPDSGATAQAESPYSEGTDPNLKPDLSQPEPSAEPSASRSESAPVPATPTIQPSSTGEIVSAESPAKAQGNLFPEAQQSETTSNHG